MNLSDMLNRPFDPLKVYFGKYEFSSSSICSGRIPNDVMTYAFREMERIVPVEYRNQVLWKYSDEKVKGWRRPGFIEWKFFPKIPNPSLDPTCAG